MESTKQFAEILRAAAPNPENSTRLTNVTFFLGAGFSKSWNSAFPVGNDLFSFTYEEWKSIGGPLEEFLQQCNYHTYDLDIGASMFKDIVYQIGMMKKYPEIRPRYVDDYNIEMVERHLRFMIRKKFEKIAPLYYEQNKKITLTHPPTTQQSQIISFFKMLSDAKDGSQGVAEGLRANFITTNYDFVIETILDQVLEPDDSYTLYTYRGLTPESYCGRDIDTTVFDNGLVGNLLKINGGFEIFKSSNGFELDYGQSKSENELRSNPPQIMLASREQDYTQPYFRALFPKVIRLLHETTILVVVGYSLPEEDALLRLIVRQLAEDRADGCRKILFYIDLSPEPEQLGKIGSIFPHASSENGLTVIPFKGSFSDWCKGVTEYVIEKSTEA
ncbi:hypothetical protein [Xanthomonas campestris]|uniref:hypothetical protein n=1 Tax=Xanthomonas campestris TaxID=339 RepID=UPI0038904C48